MSFQYVSSMRLPMRRNEASTVDPSAEALSRTPNLSRVIGGAAACPVVGWLLVKGAGDMRQFTTVTLNGLTLAALFFVVASGFTLIFGLMRVVNMAHGSLYLLCGYIAFEMQEGWFQEESEGLNLSLTSPSGAAEFGGIAKDIKTPAAWPESVTVFGVQYGFFRLVIVTGAALLIGVGLWWLIKRTRFGLIVRAGVDDRDMVSALGINVQLIFALAFLLGAL